ncbi:MAG TPA: fatty acid desaturase, partial [Solirubrobacteraceae bacterium]|nr:fatty acid desaturase [Solirubrobacteraceae bacterium]
DFLRRQVLTSRNVRGNWLTDFTLGGLNYQIEHHLFPDLPAHRYAEISVEVSEIRERYGIPYNTGPLPRQFGSVVRKIVKLALPPLPGLGRSKPDREKTAEAQAQEPAPV